MSIEAMDQLSWLVVMVGPCPAAGTPYRFVAGNASKTLANASVSAGRSKSICRANIAARKNLIGPLYGVFLMGSPFLGGIK